MFFKQPLTTTFKGFLIDVDDQGTRETDDIELVVGAVVVPLICDGDRLDLDVDAVCQIC